MDNENILKDIDELNRIAFAMQHVNKKKVLKCLHLAQELGLNFVTDK